MVSVIVPAYNAERWLEAAVASVTAQTVRDWELVLVDDGSTDGTPALCDRLAAGDRRIRAFHTPNQGVSAARNLGLKMSMGEWISFLDADDLLHPQFLEVMLDVAERIDADIVNCPLYQFKDENYSFGEIASGFKINEYAPIQAIRFGMYQLKDLHVSASGKIYHRNLWDNILFQNRIRYEDLDVFYRVWYGCKKFVQIGVPLYGYRIHPTSFMHKFGPERQDMLKVTDRMEAWAAENCPELLPAAHDRRMSANFNMFLLSEQALRQGQASREEVNDLQRRCFNVIRDRRFQSLFGRYTRPKNRIGALVSYLGPSILSLLGRLLI